MATIELDKRIWNRNVSRRNELWNLRSFGHSKNTRQLKLYAGQFVSSSKCYFNLETIFNFQWKFQFRRAIRVCQLSVEEQNERISVIEENRRNKIDKTKLRGSCGRRGGAVFAEEQRDTTEQIDKSGRTNNEKMESARRRSGEKKERKERGKGNLFLNFSLSALVSPTATDVVSFINRLDSATAERKTCSYAICHEDGASIKIDEAMTDSAKS